MTFTEKISSAFSKAVTTVTETTQKIAEKKNLKIKDIKIIPEFEKLMTIEDSVLAKMKNSMKDEGFKSGHEIHVWKRDKDYILIDGHTRKSAWESLGNKTIPCIVHHFENLEEAKKFAIKEQINRRNLSGQALLDAVANFNFEKGKGNTTGEKGKASEIIAKQIGVSPKTVEKTRCVLKEGTPEQLEAIKKDELSMNQVYNQIQEKRKEEIKKAEPAVSPTPAPEAETDSTTPDPITSTTKEESVPQINIPKPTVQKAAAASVPHSITETEKAFSDGVRHAIKEIRNGTSLEDLEKSLIA